MTEEARFQLQYSHARGSYVVFDRELGVAVTVANRTAATAVAEVLSTAVNFKTAQRERIDAIRSLPPAQVLRVMLYLMRLLDQEALRSVACLGAAPTAAKPIAIRGRYYVLLAGVAANRLLKDVAEEHGIHIATANSYFYRLRVELGGVTKLEAIRMFDTGQVVSKEVW